MSSIAAPCEDQVMVIFGIILAIVFAFLAIGGMLSGGATSQIFGAIMAIGFVLSLILATIADLPERLAHARNRAVAKRKAGQSASWAPGPRGGGADER